jgi:hypothetical protein
VLFVYFWAFKSSATKDSKIKAQISPTQITTVFSKIVAVTGIC